ncbi:serine carboxypeptidase S28-domain-containing protein [Tribonema minus]|uniref:Serine carboxypeptidase S28-domain-containing protein n=1 Tax=Tribonema minus TaxID=303371 RepID=A0A836CET7_9STRA|nr:serine carboxypeptidase S28-domain-containing protein [Tribonema minus]
MKSTLAFLISLSRLEIGPFFFCCERYFWCDEHWSLGGPMLFYCGNEADVALYVNATGAMYTAARELGAVLVFAEHRFYGQSQPFAGNDDKERPHREHLSAAQALSDYARLIEALRAGASQAVVAYGGSYGGMLATWLRAKYPHVVAGAVAGSAPVLAFTGQHARGALAFAARVTDTAARYGACADNVRRAWAPLFRLGGSDGGRAALARHLRLCTAPDSAAAVDDVALWLQDAWGTLAMGNYPWPSAYMTNGGGVLPAWPMQCACAPLSDPILPAATPDAGGDDTTSNSAHVQDWEAQLLEGLAHAAGVLYNATGTVPCFDAGAGPNPETDADLTGWGYQACTEMWVPCATDGVTDMFWDAPWDDERERAKCADQYGVAPWWDWAAIEFGGKCCLMAAAAADRYYAALWWDWAAIEVGGKRLKSLSNVVFTNGDMDPWGPLGVLPGDPGINEDSVTRCQTILLPDAAHHLDLMWPQPSDSAAVTGARAQTLRKVTQWVMGWAPEGESPTSAAEAA